MSRIVILNACVFFRICFYYVFTLILLFISIQLCSFFYSRLLFGLSEVYCWSYTNFYGIFNGTLALKVKDFNEYYKIHYLGVACEITGNYFLN